MTSIRENAKTVVVVAVLSLVVAGCAKQPVTLGASAPAPSAPVASAVPSTPPVPPTPAAPAAPRSDVPSRPAPKEFVAVADLADIRFDFDKFGIRPDAARVLDRSVTWLKSNPKYAVLVEGHCDERGTDEYNVALGERRAKATMTYLVSHGIDTRRFSLISYGEDRPDCREHNEACWAKNRRAHFLAKPE
jgi:peptidoglycan-associated lipoprotein